MNGWNSILPADDWKGREVSRVSWGYRKKSLHSWAILQLLWFIEFAISAKATLRFTHWNCWVALVWQSFRLFGMDFDMLMCPRGRPCFFLWQTNKNLHVAGLVNEERRTKIDGCSYHLTTICPHSGLSPVRVNKLWRAPFAFRISPLQYAVVWPRTDVRMDIGIQSPKNSLTIEPIMASCWERDSPSDVCLVFCWWNPYE